MHHENCNCRNQHAKPASLANHTTSGRVRYVSPSKLAGWCINSVTGWGKCSHFCLCLGTITLTFTYKDIILIIIILSIQYYQHYCFYSGMDSSRNVMKHINVVLNCTWLENMQFVLQLKFWLGFFVPCPLTLISCYLGIFLNISVFFICFAASLPRSTCELPQSESCWEDWRLHRIPAARVEKLRGLKGYAYCMETPYSPKNSCIYTMQRMHKTLL